LIIGEILKLATKIYTLENVFSSNFAGHKKNTSQLREASIPAKGKPTYTKVVNILKESETDKFGRKMSMWKWKKAGKFLKIMALTFFSTVLIGSWVGVSSANASDPSVSIPGLNEVRSPHIIVKKGTEVIKKKPLNLDPANVKKGLLKSVLADGSGAISGTVIDANLNPINGITVSIYDNNWNYYGDDSTDSDGNYTVSGLSAGSYKVNVDTYDTNYVPQWYNNQLDSYSADFVKVIDDQTSPNINFQLQMGGSVSGKVTDETGAPIQDVNIEIRDDDYNYYWGDTDSEGTYTISGIAEGDYKVHFSASNVNEYQDTSYVSQWYNNKSSYDAGDSVAVKSEETTSKIDAKLTTGGSISGTLKDSSGRPCSDENVGIYDNDNNDNEIAYGRSNSEGQYTVRGIPVGTFKVRFDYDFHWYKDKYIEREADAIKLTTKGQDIKGIDDVISGGSITGNVKDPDGKPLSGIDVIVFYYSKDGSGEGYGQNTDSDGNYSIENIKAGNYKIEFRPSDYNERNGTFFYLDSKATSVTVKVDSVTSGIDAKLKRGGGISGTISDSEGKPIKGYTNTICIEALDLNTNKYVSYDYPDSKGNYSINDLPVGTYKVGFFPVGKSTSYSMSYYDNKTSFDAAEKITISLGKATSGINAEIPNKGVSDVNVTGVSLNKKVATIKKGANETLIATITPTTATNKSVTWKSSNIDVATVDTNGKVEGLSAGTAVITVTTLDGSKTATCTVTVNDSDVIVSGVSAKAISSSEIDLTWTTVSGAKSYNIYSSTSESGKYAKIGSSKTTSFKNKKLKPSTSYWYKITVVTASGESEFSDIETAATPPAAPSGVKAKVVSSTAISLTWKAAVASTTTYNVYRLTDKAGEPTKIASGLSTAFYSDKDLTPKTTYWYKVTALNAAENESAASTLVKAVTKAR